MSRCILIALILFTVAWLQPATVDTAGITTCWDGTRLLPAPGRWYKVASRTDDYWPGFSSRTPEAVTLTPDPGMPQAIGFADWQALYDDISSPDGMISLIMLRASRATTDDRFDVNADRRHADSFEVQILPAQGLAPEGIVSLAEARTWIVFDDLAPPPRNAHPSSNDRVGGMYLYIPHDRGPALAFGWTTDYPWDKTIELYVLF